MLGFVTGASSGIGEAFACQLAAGGWDLAIAARRGDRLHALAGRLASEHGVRVQTHAADLADPGDLLGLERVIAAFPLMRKQIDDLQMVAVAGPRIDPASLPCYDGGYVPGLHLHLAACDAAIVQGGLTTTMELVAARRPFLYFPLGQHFEQQRHVRHRLERHRAGRHMSYPGSDHESIAAALAGQLATPCDYLAVPAGGAARAAGLIAELL